ncbi:MAG: hypothetical protein WDZ80_04690 [Candidatus Paceibacterota bacterium]
MSLLDYLSELNTKTQNKIRKIQRSDEKTKKSWVIKSSLVAIFFIILIWFFYLNFSLPKSVVITPVSQQEESVEKSGVLSTFYRGFQNLSEDMKLLFLNIKEKAGKTRDYSFEAEEINEIINNNTKENIE